MAKMKYSNKGQGGTLGVIIAVMVLAVLIFSVSLASNSLITPLNEIAEDIQGDDTMSDESKELITQSQDQFQSWGDNVVVFALFMLWTANMLAAFFIDTHPVFFVITVVLLVFAFVAVAILANSYDEITTDDPTLAANQQYFPKTIWIMEHLLQILIVMGISITVPIFIKVRS